MKMQLSCSLSNGSVTLPRNKSLSMSFTFCIFSDAKNTLDSHKYKFNNKDLPYLIEIEIGKARKN